MVPRRKSIDSVVGRRAMYGAPRPPHKIFRDIFASEQGDREQSEVFIGRLRASTAKLPYALDERIHLDMIYGLLNKRIRKRLTRESVQSVDELVSKARYIEDSLMEGSSVAQSRAPSDQRAGSARTRARARATCNARAAAVAVPAVL
ncbi:activity-regulated cytoskeleton associated protein 1-like [Battus philenor]|uniref:activity-regulated cytoskeleton associated protein 1-like n=1 Tax=Battus philenor TaxID=42288 RepID=UPI0035D11790